MRLDKQFLMTAEPKAVLLYDFFPEDVQFSIDSRTIRPGEIFVAIKGPHHDGHDFISAVLNKGAGGVICAQEHRSIIDSLDKQRLKNKAIILVPDTLDALVALARAWRAQFNYPVVAITGSVGKTSTKALVAHILNLHDGPYLVAHGNQNTLIGIALNMLKMSVEHKGAIFEVGIDRRGQMKQKAALVKPTIAVITSIGHSHMQGLGSIADIAAEKRDIFSSLRDDSVGVINGDQPLLADVGYPHPVVKFGAKTINQIQARKINSGPAQTTFVLKMYKQKDDVRISSNHQGAIFNALAAASVSHLLGVSVATIIKGIERPVTVEGRFERLLLKNGSGLLINDCYNANPESMKAALLALQKCQAKGKKIAILGDMLELGVDSAFWHRQLGRFLRKVPTLNHLILVGKQVQWTKKTAPMNLHFEHVPTWHEAVEKLEKVLVKDCLVLVKGSRGLQLNNLVDCFARKSTVSQSAS